MILLKKWTFLLLVPAFLIASCKSSTTTVELQGNWVSWFSFNGNARSEAVCFTIDNKTYVGTGLNDASKRLKDFWEYNAATGLWRKVKTLPEDAVARSGAVAFSVGGKGYVGTGYDDNGNRLKDFYEYTPGVNATDSGSWKPVADFVGTARQGATAFAIGSKGYVISGDDGSYLKDFWEYNPAADSWTEKAFNGNKRREGVAFVVGEKAYFGTGINNGSIVYDFWEFDPKISDLAKQWTRKRDISNVSEETFDDDYTTIARSNAAAFVIGGKGFITTGENGGNVSDCWQYDPATDVWIKKTAFEGRSRTGALGFSVNGKGFIMTGRSGSDPFDDLWEFYPDATQVDND